MHVAPSRRSASLPTGSCAACEAAKKIACSSSFRCCFSCNAGVGSAAALAFVHIVDARLRGVSDGTGGGGGKAARTARAAVNCSRNSGYVVVCAMGSGGAAAISSHAFWICGRCCGPVRVLGVSGGANMGKM